MAIPTTTIDGVWLLPGGEPATLGELICRLSQPGRLVEGGWVSGEWRALIRPDGTLLAPDGTPFALVPNDALEPVGYYAVTGSVGADGRSSPVSEKWQLASSPSTIDIGAVPRLDVVPGVAVSFGAIPPPVYTTATRPAASEAWRGKRIEVKDPGEDSIFYTGGLLADGSWGWLRGGVTDSAGPTISTFSIPATSESLTVAVTLDAPAPALGGLQWIVSEDGDPPLFDDARWGSKPSTFTLAAEGSDTLYAWAMNAAGEISARRSASCVVTIVIPPTPPGSLDTWTDTFDVSTSYQTDYSSGFSIVGGRGVANSAVMIPSLRVAGSFSAGYAEASVQCATSQQTIGVHLRNTSGTSALIARINAVTAALEVYELSASAYYLLGSYAISGGVLLDQDYVVRLTVDAAHAIVASLQKPGETGLTQRITATATRVVAGGGAGLYAAWYSAPGTASWGYLTVHRDVPLDPRVAVDLSDARQAMIGMMLMPGYGPEMGFPEFSAADADHFFGSAAGQLGFTAARSAHTSDPYVRTRPHDRGAKILLQPIVPGYPVAEADVSGDYAGHAATVVSWVQSVIAEGVPASDILGLEPVNEPGGLGADWTAAGLVLYCKALLTALDAAGLTSIKIVAPSVVNPSTLGTYAPSLIADSQILPRLILSTHDYGVLLSTPYAPAVAAGVPVWLNESSDIGPADGSVLQGLLRVETARVQIVEGRVTLAGVHLHRGGELPNIGLQLADGTHTKREWMFGQMARGVVKPGRTVVGATGSDTPDNLGLMATRSADGTQIGAAVVNWSIFPIEVVVTFTGGSAPASVTPVETSEVADMYERPAVPVVAGSFPYTVPARSFTTFLA